MGVVRLVIADDEPGIRNSLREHLERRGFVPTVADSVPEVLTLLRRGGHYDLVLSDMRLPGGSILDVVHHVRERRLRCGVVVISAHADVTEVVQALRMGALDYLQKPFRMAELDSRVNAALQRVRGMSGSAEPPGEGEQAVEPPPESPLLGVHPSMQRLRRLLRRYAGCDGTVLITGESGTGKELVAREIHRRSERSGGRFIAVNCAAIPETLLESELFGHVRGSFTGAVGDRVGYFELADAGTIFLDEIGDMPPPMQVKLLRTLQEGTFTPVGAGAARYSDFRVVAATHRDLVRAVAEGHFRDDLFFRLNVLPLTVPPLRERGNDIALLADAFLREFCAGPRGLRFSPQALEALRAYAWPGNVRELRNFVYRATLLRPEGVIAADDLAGLRMRRRSDASEAPSYRLPPEGARLGELMASFERGVIAQALAYTGGNKKAAAELLEVNRTTLSEKIRRLGM